MTINGEKVTVKLNDVGTFTDKGNKLSLHGNYNESLVWYDKALEIEPNNAYILYDKGHVLSELGQDEEALIWFNRALEIVPDFFWHYSKKPHHYPN